MKLSFVSDSCAKSCIFMTVLPTLFPFLLLVLNGQTRCSKDYDDPRGLCTEQIDDFNFPRELMVYWLLAQAVFTVRQVFSYLFAVLLGFGKANHKR